MEEIVTREQVLTYIMQHETLARRDFLDFAKYLFHKHENIPASVRSKFLLAGDQYGKFNLDVDWMKELESEVWDGICYSGLERFKKEMYD